MGSIERHSGGCLCGAIRYVAEGSPTSVNACYCTQCQKETGAPLPAFASFLATALTVTGAPASYKASERATREFCGRCGSPLFWRPVVGEELDVFLGSFDEPARLPAPSYAIWAAHRVPWLPELHGVPTYAGARPPES